MPPNRAWSSEAHRWLRYAEEDLAAAHLMLASLQVFPKQACYHAQQAAEKALKSVLVAHGIPFPRTHDLLALARLLPLDDASLIAGLDLGDLSTWVVTARYPMDPEEATTPEAHGAVAMAELLCERIRRRMPTA